MIDFARLERRSSELAAAFAAAAPYRHVVVDAFADDDALEALRQEIPDPMTAGINKSRDYVFAKNKFEKSGFTDFGPRCQELYDELCSPPFARFLSTVCGEEVFVDPDFHGGGLHQGGEGSFLDMHVDFNVHPAHDSWFRNLNVLLYLNQGWAPDWGGQLKLCHKETGAQTTVDPLFGRMLIMETRGHTLHGFDAMSFPAGRFRQSIACYAYSPIIDDVRPRSTVWYPDSNGPKRLLGRYWPALVGMKNRVFGSRTAKNK
jgi:Rps23 Pro-64 3,4-dihydroxylase Tpa1-like proline 4-hydroxylase